MLWYLGFADPEETAPSRASQFLEIGKTNPANAFLMQINQFWAQTPTRSSQGSHILGHYSSALNTSGPGTQTTRVSLYAPEPAEIIWTSQSKTYEPYFACSFPRKPQ